MLGWGTRGGGRELAGGQESRLDWVNRKYGWQWSIAD